jgi:predicted transposase/invertase (TIGR01784 family)
VAEFLALAKDAQFSYQQDLKARWDNQACLDYAEGKGIERGIEKGIQEGIEKGAKNREIEIARTSLAQNIDISTISLITGLTIEEIENLK